MNPRRKISRLVAKMVYCLAQGVFFPLILVWDTYWHDGDNRAWAIFGAYELLVVLDAFLYWWIFERS